MAIAPYMVAFGGGAVLSVMAGWALALRIAQSWNPPGASYTVRSCFKDNCLRRVQVRYSGRFSCDWMPSLDLPGSNPGSHPSVLAAFLTGICDICTPYIALACGKSLLTASC